MSHQRSKPIIILMADDDEDDRLFTQEALAENRIVNDLYFVEDGEDLMDYLYQRGKYSDPGVAPRPTLILLDLNMPRKDGREALQEIKQDPDLRSIPVVILTTSKAEEDILRTYDLGASSFITKP
ncbi:MAG: response regulator, partial [Leptolyngbyaceae cyanobacterium MAG.088]|nr:response regulator [Leptolyngbyaceae cyanobacterium MAG.088]